MNGVHDENMVGAMEAFLADDPDNRPMDED